MDEVVDGIDHAMEETVTPVTPDVLQTPEPTLTATNGQGQPPTHGHTNGLSMHIDPGCDPLCPQCGKDKCVSYGVGGRVCMGCAYCERPLRPSR
jgi:hypothetical protein